MKHPLLSLTTAELISVTVSQILQANRHLTLGDYMMGPCGSMLDGKIHHGRSTNFYTAHDSVIKLDASFTPAHVMLPEPQSCSANTYKIPFTSNLEQFATVQQKFIHPYQVAIPHASWLNDYEVGDKMTVMDDAGCPHEVVLTREMFDHHSYVVFRAGFSD